MNTEAPQRWQLSAGQTVHLPVARGCQLAVLAGRVRVQWPVNWLGEIALRHSVDSGEGLACRFERAGWVAVQALANAEICLQPDQARAAQPQWTWTKAPA